VTYLVVQSGRLRIRESPGISQRAEGSIEILDGAYSVLGQELTIDPGQLVFNGLAENPRLNVRAYRTVEGNLVGVHLGSRVETLSSSLYSAPGLPQTEILSLLVTGKSLSNTSSSKGKSTGLSADQPRYCAKLIDYGKSTKYAQS